MFTEFDGSDGETVPVKRICLIILPSTAYNDAQERAQKQDRHYGDCNALVGTTTDDKE
jgi:hypothetical protein